MKLSRARIGLAIVPLLLAVVASTMNAQCAH